MNLKQFSAAVIAAVLCAVPFTGRTDCADYTTVHAAAASIADLPTEYQTAADWIWTNRTVKEDWMKNWNTIYDQIVAGNGTLHYVVKWQSDKTLTLEQRKKIPQVLEASVNKWTDWLVGYENWPFTHVNVEVVGWAVLDVNCLQDLQPDEVVYTDKVVCDSSYVTDGNMAVSDIPEYEPIAPTDLFRDVHWADKSWTYNGNYENRFDMYFHGMQGMIDFGGFGYHWGQQLSDNAILGLCDGTTSTHILEHEMGHGFGFSDFYGGEGEADGYPPGGFPGGGTSIMMAGSSSVITDFDGWFARYAWTKLAAEEGRFDLSAPVVTTTTVTTEYQPVESTTTTTTALPPVNIGTAQFADTIQSMEIQTEGASRVTFAQNGSYTFSGTDYYGGDENKNLSHYEAGDRITVQFSYNQDTGEILSISYLQLEQNIRTRTGDVNADGQFSIADLVMMQKFLIRGGTLTDWQQGDLYEDSVIDARDLVLMRRMLSGQSA